jgi:hypothetical protein
VLIPVVFIAVMLVVQFALAYHARQVLAGATQDGAAAAARYQSSPGDGVILTRSLIAGSAGGLVHDTSVTASSTQRAVTVEASAQVISLLPFFQGITVRAASSAAFETFNPQGAQP